MLLWKIAWRNLWRHKGKSLVIGLILFLGALLMTAGNAVIEGAKQGLEENMINRFTGHLILAAENEKKENVFFINKAIKVIPDYPAVKSLLQQQDFIDSFLPITRGNALVLNEEGEPGFVFVLGVNFDDYQKTFSNNVAEVEGTLLKNGERGILVPTTTREQLFEFSNFWIVPEGGEIVEDHLTPEARDEKDRLQIKDNLVIMGFGGDSLEMDIRLPVKGIVKFKSFNEVWKGTAFIDIESFRECFGYVTAADNIVVLTADEEAVLAMDNLEEIFEEADILEETETNVEDYDIEAMQQQTTRTEADIDLDTGAYNLVLVKLNPGLSLKEGQERLSQIVEDADAPVKVLTWKQAVGEVAQFATMTQGALFVFVLFIFFVAAIIIMNTLSMAAIERISEIGMMRAIGARKGFVSWMFFAETALLSAFFSGLGVVIGVVVVWVVAALNIPTTGNEILGLLVGGDTLHPIANVEGIVIGMVLLAIVTLLAMIYPIIVARKITPLEAISRD